jgi:hypothetical protein
VLKDAVILGHGWLYRVNKEAVFETYYHLQYGGAATLDAAPFKTRTFKAGLKHRLKPKYKL